MRGSWNLVMHEDESRNKARRERERPCSVMLAVRGKTVAGLLLQASKLGLELEAWVLLPNSLAGFGWSYGQLGCAWPEIWAFRFGHALGRFGLQIGLGWVCDFGHAQWVGKDLQKVLDYWALGPLK